MFPKVTKSVGWEAAIQILARQLDYQLLPGQDYVILKLLILLYALYDRYINVTDFMVQTNKVSSLTSASILTFQQALSICIITAHITKNSFCWFCHKVPFVGTILSNSANITANKEGYTLQNSR